MEPEGPLLWSREPAGGPYPEPGESSPHPITLPSTPKSCEWPLPCRLSNQNFVRIRLSHPRYMAPLISSLIWSSNNIFGEYKLWSFSLCSFLQPPVTLFLLGPNIVNTFSLSMLVFWVVTPCGLVGRYRRFGETYCLHLQALKLNTVCFSETLVVDTDVSEKHTVSIFKPWSWT
jgi:hypothetical protein